MSKTAWSDQSAVVAGSKLHLVRGGKGQPLLVLAHDIGTLERLPIYTALSQSCEVVVPHHPGWGRSERPQWLRSVRDVAVMYQCLGSEFGLEKPILLGLGFGGWIAAEMATMAPKAFDRLILVGPMGIKPPEGDILDQAIVSYIDYARAGFHDQKAFDANFGADPSTDQLEQWDIAREMCFRIAWKPYMYSQTLPHLLGGVRAPSLIVWGEQDKVVPLSAAKAWKTAIPGSRLEIVKGCGHCVEMEKPAVLAELIASFIGKA